MFTRLGLDAVTEAVYRAKLDHPQDGVAELAARLDMDRTDVRDALVRLSEMALVRMSGDDRSQVRLVDPRLGMEILLARQQAELIAQQQAIEATRAAAAELIAAYADVTVPHAQAGLRYLHGVDVIRDQIELLSGEVREEFLTFAPGGPQAPENMRASRPLNQSLLERGVRMRTIYLDSIRRDQPTVEHAEWLESMGAQVRTVPTLPNRVIVFDRRAALIAADAGNTGAGAALVTSPGMITLLCSLFEHVWQSAEPLGAAARSESGSLTRQQLVVLRMMADGRTDEAIANSLGVSTRTVRRTATGLLSELNARSRFQAGVRAVQLGHLPPTSD
ncbi:LuxR C-terminal-related transcriptional regulator [Streptomyces sp. NRRL F-4428]|uniref:LuxR C-terminal-related transcriptional regulator n=1 Tax=Streptomyces sp. NRRL F-4428 TaxID=1609137 RepID=UPI0005ECAE80|nr:LuxR C-terminal-related transcriptional regulator [Streptomyces sp. NRRL F-4428]KJK45327.1 erythropoiesis-stimulating protein [Streptomyces sp. NRRL F-4428]